MHYLFNAKMGAFQLKEIFVGGEGGFVQWK